MKKLLALLFITISSFQSSFSQETKTTNAYTVVEEMPQFPGGGEAALLKYIGTNLHYPSQARLNNIQGMVYASFVIDKNGDVTQSQIIRGLSRDIDAEALRVINNMPKWKPGKQDGKEVAVVYYLPLKFTLYNRHEKQKKYAQNQKYFNKGTKYFNKKKYEDAIENFTKAIKARPDDGKSYSGRGACYMNLANYDSACTDWQKAKDLGEIKSDELIAKYCGAGKEIKLSTDSIK